MDNASISLYHTFCVVAEAESISAAAKELYISQPAVSKSIKKLESILNTTLFTRTSRGIHLTNEGQILYEYIHSAFETISAGEDTLKRMNDLGISHIRIGVSSTLCKHVLLPYLKGFLELYPHTQITIECQSTVHTIHRLENKEIDIGLIAQPDNNKSLCCIPAGNLQDTFVATKQYITNLMERENISKSDIIRKASLILLDKKNMTRRFIDNYLSQWNIDADNAMEVNSMELLIDFAKTGLGAACIIRQFIEPELDSGQLIEIPLPGKIKKRKICFAYSLAASQNSTVHSFINYILKDN